MSFYVIDDIRLVPSGRYEFCPLQHREAVEELKQARLWSWYIKNIEGESFHRLEVLARESGLTLDGDNLSERRRGVT